jgi:hypothetical protein
MFGAIEHLDIIVLEVVIFEVIDELIHMNQRIETDLEYHLSYEIHGIGIILVHLTYLQCEV